MLKLKNLDNRTFDARMAEALTQLPLYTEDWTNYNPSDPGVTILENLTAFENIQLEEISEISDAVRFGLLKMCGFETKRGKAAKLLLTGHNLKEEVILPANKQMKLGDMSFETEKVTKVYPYHLKNVYGYHGGEFHDYSRIAIGEVDIPTPIFGKNPSSGDEVYFLMDGMPEPGEDLICYVNVADRYNRNPIREKDSNIFAILKYQVYTENGFVDTFVKDTSGGFLMNGEIRVRMPEIPTAIYDKTPTSGYCIRVVLKSCDYDIPPQLLSAYAFMFEVFQKETLATAVTYQKPKNVKIFNDLADEGHIRVYAKEQKGTSYYQYDMALSGEYSGRYYRLIKHGQGMYDIEFDKEAFGYAPEKTKNAVKVLVFGDKLMRRYSIGTIRGFDNEEIMLPLQNIMTTSFSIMARRRDENGVYIYDFVRPGKDGDGALKFVLYESQGRIVIEDPGDYVGAELFIATATVFRGKEGNVRAGNVFKIDEGEFINPGKGIQGCFRENLSELHKRFIEDLHKPYTAITESDYEMLVKEIPQLCIRKVKAYADTAANLVKVAVMPGTDEQFPMLSPLYVKTISNYLDERRLITTRIEVVQPVYVPVNVYGTIYVKSHFGDCREMIENAIRAQIDYANNDCNFGETLSFDRVFHIVESLPCVEYIYDLSIRPALSARGAMAKDSDIVIAENMLLYPGEISLDIGAYHDSNGAII